MKLVTVYRVDYVRKTRVPIGWVEERRRSDRGSNLLGLIRLARSIYGTGDEDSIYITVDGKEARGTGRPLPEARRVRGIPRGGSDPREHPGPEDARATGE